MASRPATARLAVGKTGATDVKPASARGAKPVSSARPATARVSAAAAKKKEEEEKKADTKKSSFATPGRVPGKAAGLKPVAAKPAATKPATASSKVAPKATASSKAVVSKPGSVVAKADPTKPKAAQSDWLIYLKLSGGPFPKEVKEAKIAECK